MNRKSKKIQKIEKYLKNQKFWVEEDGDLRREEANWKGLGTLWRVYRKFHWSFVLGYWAGMQTCKHKLFFQVFCIGSLILMISCFLWLFDVVKWWYSVKLGPCLQKLKVLIDHFLTVIKTSLAQSVFLCLQLCFSMFDW